MTLRNRKVGGIRFIRIGRLQVSLCWCKSSRKAATMPEPRRESTLKARIKSVVLREAHAMDWALLATALTAAAMTACTAWAR